MVPPASHLPRKTAAPRQGIQPQRTASDCTFDASQQRSCAFESSVNVQFHSLDAALHIPDVPWWHRTAARSATEQVMSYATRRVAPSGAEQGRIVGPRVMIIWALRCTIFW